MDASKYEFDVNLDPVLNAGYNEELDVLIRLLKSGDYLKNIEKERLFMRHYPDHKRYAHLISMQLRSCGGHAIANLFRGGKGPDYRTVVTDVADHLDVEYSEDDSVPVIEREILMAMTKDIYNDLGESERKLLVDSLSAHQADSDDAADTNTEAADAAAADANAAAAGASKTTAVATVQSRELVVQALEKGDYKLLSNSSLLMLSQTLSQVLSRIAGVAETGITTVHDGISRAASELASEILRGLHHIKRLFAAIFDIGGPAYKVTVPCVTQIAAMRLRQSSAVLEKHNPTLLAKPNQDDADGTSAAEPAAAPADSDADDETEKAPDSKS